MVVIVYVVANRLKVDIRTDIPLKRVERKGLLTTDLNKASIHASKLISAGANAATMSRTECSAGIHFG